MVRTLFALAGFTAVQAQQTPFTSSTDLVVVPAVVVDSRGQAVTGLTQDDFEIREDGKAMAVTTH